LHGSYRNSSSALALDSVVTAEERIGLENTDANTGTYDMMSIDDVVPIENARARFLQIFIDHFIDEHVIQVDKSGDEVRQNMSNKMSNKRRQTMDIEYEGDPRFVLPLMYVANLYETLVNDVNMRLASFSNGIREKSIGISLEAAGGLYRRLASKYPKKGGSCSYKRRELAKSLETRTRFPELFMQDEKHVFRFRFVVINGLSIVEEPIRMTIEEAEWFKRLSGRNEIRISARDYKFYSPRHKYRIIVPPVSPNIHLPIGQNLLPQAMSKHHIQLPHHSTENPSQLCNVRQSSNLSQVPQLHEENMTCIQSLTSLAKYCDQCGTLYVRETSKYCSECGVKRLGI